MNITKSTKRIISVFLFAIILISIFSISGINAYAYNTIGYTWKSSTIRYYYDSYNSSRAKSYFIKGAQGWDSTDVNFTSSSSAGSYNIYCTEVSNSNVSWDGLTSYTSSGKYYKSQTLTLNKAKTTTWESNNALKSVVIHEFGHCLGLDHKTGKVIMNPYTWGTNSRYGAYGISTIQTDDKNGANALY